MRSVAKKVTGSHTKKQTVIIAEQDIPEQERKDVVEKAGRGVADDSGSRFRASAPACLLSFAAGVMIYVVMEELIPEMWEEKQSKVGTVLFAVRLTVMMALGHCSGRNRQPCCGKPAGGY